MGEKSGKASKKAPKDARKVKATEARPKKLPSTTDAPKASAPKAAKRKSSKGYDPTKDGPLHKDHPLVVVLYALSRAFGVHAIHYQDNGAFIVHRILSAVGRAIGQEKGNDLSREKGIYSAARNLLRDYGDLMPDEDTKGHPVPFTRLAGRFRILRELLALLIEGHDEAMESAKRHGAALVDPGVQDTKLAMDPVDHERFMGEVIEPSMRILELPDDGFRDDALTDQSWPPTKAEFRRMTAHSMATFRIQDRGIVLKDHWRKPAKFEDNARYIWSCVFVYFWQIPSIRDARQDRDCDIKLGERIYKYLQTFDERRAKKIAEYQKQGIEYSVDELAEDLAEDILRSECKFSKMTDTEISKLFGFLNPHKKKAR